MSILKIFSPRFLVIIMVALSAVPSSVVAEDIRAQDVKIFTPTYQPVFSEFEPPLGVYTYRVAWQGIPAATVTVKVDRNENKYKVTTKAKTYSGIDLFYRLRYTAEGTISALDLTPIETVIDHRENSRHKITKISFEKNGGIRAVRYRKGPDNLPEELEFNSNNFTLDPISAAFLARGVDWKLGESKQFDTFNGKSRYLITLTASNLTKIKVNGSEREAWEIIPKVENLTSPTADKKLRSAKILLSTDRSREVLQIVSSVFIGSVSTTLTAFEPALKPTELAMKFISAKRTRQANNS